MNQKRNEYKAEKYEIFTGFRKVNSIEAKLLVGAAFKEEDLSYYKIRLMMFPGNTYYLVKNKDAVDRYTIYSKMIIDAKNKNQVKFLNPVGNGVLDSKNTQKYYRYETRTFHRCRCFKKSPQYRYKI